MSRRFTRQEFYELVWSKPMTHLAKEFNLSDVALHKICRKHDIPNPPLGWWAKQAAGHKVKRTPLPARKADISDAVVIASGEVRTEPDHIANAREQARVRASEFNPSTPVEAHPIVTRSIDRLRKAKIAENGLVSIDAKDLIPLTVAPSSIDRLETCLNTIVAAAKAQGFELSKRGEKVAFTDGTVTLPFSVTEAVKRSKHVPTEEERAEQERRSRRRSGRSWDFELSLRLHSPWPEWDYNPTGRLSFEVDIYLGYSASAVRRSFRDAKIQRLENLAPDIAVGLVVLAAAKLEYDREVEAARIRAAEEKQRRIEAERRAHIEERRSKTLDIVFDRIERRDRLRILVAQLGVELTGDDLPRVTEFVRWAEDVLARSEQRASATGLADLFEKERVFGDDDDRGFYPRSSW